MLKIEIKSNKFETKEKRENKGQYGIQKGYAFTFDKNGQKPYPEEIQIFVPRVNGNLTPYQPGFYTLTLDSVRVGQYGKLEIGFINLVLVTTEAKKAG